jgi:hypothetical protein
VSNLSVVTQQDFGGFPPDFSAQKGVTYFISIMASVPGEFSTSLNLLPKPQNDDFADAISLTGSSVNFSGTTAGSIPEPLDDTYGVWWKWIAPSSGRIIIEPALSPANLSLEVLRGESLSYLVSLPTLRTSSGGWTFDAEAGRLYRFRVNSAPAPVSFEMAYAGANPPATLVSRPSADAGNLTIALSGKLGQFVSLQASQDLREWTTIAIYRLGAADVVITLPTDADRRFFRTVSP